MLDGETTLEYIKAAQRGDEYAKEQLIVHNMPLIKSIVARYRGNATEYEDLIQLGSMGLVKAINNFDTNYNVRFSTYAVPMIAGEIKRFIRDDGAIKVSRALKTLSMSLKKEIESHRLACGEAPSAEMLAGKFGITPQEVVFALDSSKYPVSLYEKFDDENNQSVIDKLPSDDNGENIDDKILLKEVISTLPEREKKVLILRYYRDKTQSEIAKILGVSQVQVSRIESKVIGILRKAFQNEA